MVQLPGARFCDEEFLRPADEGNQSSVRMNRGWLEVCDLDVARDVGEIDGG